MNHIYIIGNGFDISHGLPTKYRDFILWYLYEKYQEIRSQSIITDKKENDDGLMKFKWNSISYINSETIKNFTSVSDFKKAIALITFNNSLTLIVSPFLEAILNKDGWADIENIYFDTIVKASKLGYGNDYGIVQINSGMNTMKLELKRYLKDIIMPKISEQFPKDSLIRIFTDDAGLSVGERFIVNFNYTGTLGLYKEHVANAKKFHIHGRVLDDEEMIFGYGNEKDPRYSEIETLDDEYLENIKSILYTNTEVHSQIINCLSAGEYYVHVIGHSLGEPDWSFLSTVLQHKACKKVELHYFKEGKFDNFSELSKKISRILPIDTKISLSSLVVPKTKAKSMS